MAASYVLNLQIAGMGQMQQLVAQTRQLQQAQRALSSGSGGAGSSSSGPLARLQSALSNVAKNPGSFDAQYRAAQAQKSFQRAQNVVSPPNDFIKRLTSFISTSRVGLGGGGMTFMPLIGRFMSLFGVTGPLGLAITAAAAVVTAFGATVAQATENLTAMRDAMLATGGTSSNIAGLNALGVGSEQIGGASRRFHDVGMTNPFAMQMRGRFGLGPALPGPLGKINQAEDLEKAIKGIATQFAVGGAQIRAARAADLESLLSQIQFYSKHADTVEADTAAMKGIADDATISAAGELSQQFGRLGRSLQMLGMAIAKPVIEPLSKFFGFIADLTRNFAATLTPLHATALTFTAPILGIANVLLQAGSAIHNVLTSGPLGKAVALLQGAFGKVGAALMRPLNAVGAVFQRVLGFFEKLGGGVLDKVVKLIAKGVEMFATMLEDIADFLNNLMDRLGLPKSDTNDLKQALNDNTKATQDQNNLWKQGINGGGDRARGALPAALRGEEFSRAVAGNSLRLGAFTFR